MAQHKPHLRKPAFVLPAEAPVRPTTANKIVVLQGLVRQYDEARKAANGQTGERAIERADMDATRAYRHVAAYFSDQIGIDKSTYAHMQPAPKDFMALCTRLGIEFSSFVKTKREGALVHKATQEETIGKIKGWLAEHPHAPKPSGQQHKL